VFFKNIITLYSYLINRFANWHPALLKAGIHKKMKTKIIVSPNKGDWKVKNPDNKRASGIYDTKAEALKEATKLAKTNKAELIVQNLDGTIGLKNSFGNDPRKIKG
jgi:hypothetical protein